MKTYKIYEKDGWNIDAVPVSGFNWWAFFLPTWWAFFKGHYRIFFGLILLLIVYGLAMGAFLTDAQAGAATFVLGIGVRTYFGIKGHQWNSDQLEDRGFRQITTVRAKSAKQAREYFGRDLGMTIPAS